MRWAGRLRSRRRLSNRSGITARIWRWCWNGSSTSGTAPKSPAWNASSAARLRNSPTGRAATHDAHRADSRRARMKAVRLLEYGGQLVFNDIPTPTIARDEVLVKIKSTAVNHLDLVKASGAARQILPIDLPWIPGHEFSGVVEHIGSDVAAYAPGDTVFAANETGGAYAEYLAVKPAAIARKPSNLSFEEAASVPVAAQTAWQGLFTHGHLEKGQTILIHGGAGAVGA